MMHSEPFEIRAKRGTKTVEGTTFDVFDLCMRGAIQPPRPVVGYPFYVLATLDDITEGTASPKPVICMIKNLQSGEGPFFAYRSDVEKLPHAHSLLSNWTPIVSVPIAFLEFPRRGKRTIRFRVQLVCARTDMVFEEALCTGNLTAVEDGYLDFVEKKEKADELSIQLFMAVSAADGEMDSSEAECVKEWIRGRISVVNSSNQP